MRYFILFLGVFGILSSSSPIRAAESSLEQARTLIQQGKNAEALAALEAVRKALPAEARLTKWSIDFQGRAVPVVLIGKKHLYFTTTCSRNAKPGVPALPDTRPLLDDKTGIYDFNNVITCVDAATGKKLWSRQTPGHNDIAIDPRSDHLYVWREKLFRLKPENGEVDLEKELEKQPQRVRALVIGGKPFVPQPPQNYTNDDTMTKLQTYNVDTGALGLEDVLAPHRLAPDEARRLHVGHSFSPHSHTTISGRPLKELVKAWEYRHPEVSYNEPFWLGDDVVALNGNEVSKAEVIRLKGGDGSVQWRFPLPRGAYSPGRDQLPGNAYPPRTWSAVGLCDKQLLAIGGEGTLYFLDAATGKLEARATPSTSHLAFPRVVEGALIVAGIPGIRAIPREVLLQRSTGGEKEVILLQAQCLAAQEKYKEALAALNDLLEQMPELVEAWALKAKLAQQANQPLDEIGARCRLLELTGKDSSPELRERFGLLKRIATNNDITLDLKRVGNTIYAGTRGGFLYSIDARSLEVVEKKEFPAAINMLLGSGKLQGLFSDQQRDLVEFKDGEVLGPPKAPAEWRTVSGYDGRVVRWQGKYYRPLGKGNVRVLDGEVVHEHKTRLGGIESWQIDISPAGPLGYGAGGVYELDQNLCPTRNLFDQADIQRPLHVALLASDLKTMSFLAYPGNFQIWTRDGKKKLREQTDLTPGYLNREEGRLLPLAGGYLLCAGDLAWLSPSADVRDWRFGFGDKPTSRLPKIHFAHANLFGKPLLHGHLLFVGCRDGGIYVFDVNAIISKS